MNRTTVARALGAAVLALGLAAGGALPAVAGPAAEPTADERATAQRAAAQSSMGTLNTQAERATDSVASWYVDRGTVVVSATDVDAAQAFVRSAGIDASTVRIEQVAAQPQMYGNLVGGDAIFTGGARCSLGFNATGGGATYVITAGHCTNIGSPWTSTTGEAIGPVAASSFPGNDYGAIQVTNPAQVATGQVTGIGPVRGSAEVGVGAGICRSGSTTGVRCGTVQAKNVTVNYGADGIVFGLTQTNACSEPGDSGGSVVSGDQAQGLTSGGSGNCTVGGTMFYQEINEVLGAYSLALVTG